MNLVQSIVAASLVWMAAGCNYNVRSDSTERAPAQVANIQTPPRPTYRTSMTCAPGSSDPRARAKISALSGLLVGPMAAASFPNLDEVILRPFRSDGCSSSPDGFKFAPEATSWLDCCLAHDTEYWLGGSSVDRKKADANFKACIANHGHPQIANIYHRFVRNFGGPLSKQGYRWGYGWTKHRPYKPIEKSDLARAQLLYEGVDRDQIFEKILESDYILERVCDNRDPIFFGLSQEEKLAYVYLNSKLKTGDTIEWAKWGSFNFETRNLEIKLQNCATPTSITFSLKTKTLLSVENGCL